MVGGPGVQGSSLTHPYFSRPSAPRGTEFSVGISRQLANIIPGDITDTSSIPVFVLCMPSGSQ